MRLCGRPTVLLISTGLAAPDMPAALLRPPGGLVLVALMAFLGTSDLVLGDRRTGPRLSPGEINARKLSTRSLPLRMIATRGKLQVVSS